MPVFTHEPVDPDDPATLEAIYELGIASQMPGELGCSPIPYPTLDQVAASFKDETLQRYLVYADGELRVAIAFDDEGIIRFCKSKPWLTIEQIRTATEPHPNGIAQSNYFSDLVRAHAGVVRSYNNSKDPLIQETHKQSQVTVIETIDGVPTGEEIPPPPLGE